MEWSFNGLGGLVRFRLGFSRRRHTSTDFPRTPNGFRIQSTVQPFHRLGFLDGPRERQTKGR